VPATQRPATIPIIVIVFAAIWFALLTRTVLPYAAL
jgi:hypothetical protein